ncbi:MAG: transcription-repair coupling factor [Nitrospiraceae bacterium]|nr:MAG: transcription-repair coupling factor [Nitrospiraceae bacterium]
MELHSFHQFEKLSGIKSHVYNLTGSSAALFLALQGKPFVAIAKDEEKAKTFFADIAFYRDVLRGEQVLFLPDLNGPASAGCRTKLIYNLKKTDSLVTSAKNIRSPLWDKKSAEKILLKIKKGDRKVRNELEQSLIGLGYRRVSMVVEKGEYSRREWITDVYPSTADIPLRISFFGDEIDEIKSFVVDTQRSEEVLNECVIYPSSGPDEINRIADVVGDRTYYCLDSDSSGSDLPQDTQVLSRYPFNTDVLSETDAHNRFSQYEYRDAGMLSISGHGILPAERRGLGAFVANIKDLSAKNRVVIIASSLGQAERLKDIFLENDSLIPLIDTREIFHYKGDCSIALGKLSSGLFLQGLLILTEREVFGKRPSFRPLLQSKVSNLLFSLDDITEGDFVVHRQHGIGRFSGMVRQTVHESELELLVIAYADGRLYIPVENIQLISKYHSREGTVPTIDRLGGKTWQKKKARARKKINKLAANLMSLYADRRAMKGFACSADSELHREFDSFFDYEETPDQIRAINDIKRDMESNRPMDRLLCGDVGYGKTEVAMRAAFKSVYDNRQVAVLVPTTILAEQHFRTFTQRFSGFPITIDFVSRFKSKKENSETLKAVARGEIDIIIGTHSLITKKMQFSGLGLLIIDEEHRFGVGQKEKMKDLAIHVDVLTLTATPIPRTLHMALSGIRDMSVIETPPEERLAVKSIVTRFNDELVKDAVTRELQREGQTFFVHNRIQNIQSVAGRIQEIVPSATVGIAHGRMPEKELEDIMVQFFEGELDVLVSTSIIGSGLDIPRANTIVINRADKLGLADLYQLRGRVGRSNVKAHAFFLIPGASAITEEAKKRLHAIQEMSYLGAGFRLAMKDLEIRGAGNIFGPEQSGHIQEIGLDLYIEMLEQAVAELKGIKRKEVLDPEIDLKISAFIPDNYVDDITVRLSLYRRIASLKDNKDIINLESELKDRFGPVPEEITHLLDVMRLKIAARELSLRQIRQSDDTIRFVFSEEVALETHCVLDMCRKKKDELRLLAHGFEIRVKDSHWNVLYEKTYGILKGLKPKMAHGR